MKIISAFKAFFVFFIASLLAFVFYGQDILFLAKAIALSIALTLLYIIYLAKSPSSINVGKEVFVIGGSRYLIGKKGIALTKARVNEKLRVKTYDGKESEAIVEKTEGLLSPAIVRIIYEEELVK